KAGADSRHSASAPADNLATRRNLPFVDRASFDAAARRRFPGNSHGADACDDYVGHALAAPAIEGEAAGERRTELLVELRAQQDTRTVQPGLHRLRLQAEEVGGFVNAHALDDASDEHRAECVGKLVDRVFEHRT